jgi:hypothetical protein
MLEQVGDVVAVQYVLRHYITEPAPGERFDVDWGHFGALVYNGATRKLYASCLVESHSRKMYLEFTLAETLDQLSRFRFVFEVCCFIGSEPTVEAAKIFCDGSNNPFIAC